MSNQKISEYSDRYCCPQRTIQCVGNTTDYRCARGMTPGCQISYEKQPIGGKSQEIARQQNLFNISQKQANMSVNLADMANVGLPVYDQDHVATVYRQVDCGKFAHVADSYAPPHSQDHAHRQCLEADQMTGQGRKLVYRTTMVDPMYPPVQPLSVVGVHKLRYMTNDYMTADDWY